jgi:hypothetical protein
MIYPSGFAPSFSVLHCMTGSVLLSKFRMTIGGFEKIFLKRIFSPSDAFPVSILN